MKNQLTLLLTVAALALALCNARAIEAVYTSSGSYAIADNSPNSGVASSIDVSGVAEVVAVNSVSFTISGGWAGDFSVALAYVGANGVTVASTTLFSALQGGSAANTGFDDVVLTSSTGSDITTAGGSSSSPISGTYSGVDFSAFSGVSSGGSWILYVTDNGAGESGTLTGWSLSLDVVPEPTDVALGIFAGLLVVTGLARSPRVRALFQRKAMS